jgi:hypothetical protein
MGVDMGKLKQLATGHPIIFGLITKLIVVLVEIAGGVVFPPKRSPILLLGW